MRRRVFGRSPDGQPPLREVARRAVYVGSAEHKGHPTGAGPPRLRADTTPCDPSIDTDQATRWLRAAIRAGLVSETWERGFPRYVWTRVRGIAYEARHGAGADGHYKGWPLLEDELPEGLG